MKYKLVVLITLGSAMMGLLSTSPRAQENKAAHSAWDGIYTKEQAKRNEARKRVRLHAIWKTQLVGLIS